METKSAWNRYDAADLEKLGSVCEGSRCVPIDTGGIHLLLEDSGVCFIISDNCLTMSRTILVNVFHGFL